MMSQRKEMVPVVFHELPWEILCKLPWELWLRIKKFTTLFTLKHSLQFPTVICRRRYHFFYADCWQAYTRNHRWDIESSGSSMTSLISHHFRDKRLSFDWSGLRMTAGERLFRNGMPTSVLFDALFGADVSPFSSDEDMDEEEDEEDEEIEELYHFYKDY